MTYSNVPLSGQSLGITKNPINSNFALTQTAFSVNHYAIGSAGGSNSGKHMFVTMPRQSTIPTRSSGDTVLYNYQDPYSPNESVLFINTQNNKLYQLTKSFSAQASTFGATPNGWTFLPGGFIMQYGQVTNPGMNGTVTFPFAFPNGVPFQIQLTMWAYSGGAQSASLNINPSAGGASPTKTAFIYATSAASSSSILNWSAIGT